MANIGYYSAQELKKMGFGSIGKDVRISKTATLYNNRRIFIGDNVRIDNFCVLALSGKAKLFIGDNVHISVFSFINGMGDVHIEPFVTLAPYVRIFSSADDYSGRHMTGATLPAEFLGAFSKRVVIRKHAIIGTGSAVMPGVELGRGTAVGAYSFVTGDSAPFTVIAGIPAKYLKKRSMDLLKLEEKYLKLRRA